jgi:hypothetical protein
MSHTGRIHACHTQADLAQLYCLTCQSPKQGPRPGIQPQTCQSSKQGHHGRGLQL